MRVSLIILIITIIISFFPLECYDFFWHLKTGEYIFKNGIPREDPFSYNSKGIWINHAWGWDLFAFLLFKIGGFNLLFFFKYLLVFLMAYLLCLLCKDKNFSPFFSFFLIFWALSLSRHRLDLRPDAAGHLFFLILLYLLHNKRYIFIPVLLLFWTNIHASFIFGAIFSAFYFFFYYFKKRSRNFLIYLALTLIFPLLNPFFLKAYLAPIQLSFKVKTLNLINPEWLFAPFIPFFAFYLSIPIVLILFFFDEERLKKLLFIPVLFLSITSLRFIGFFSLSLPFFLEKEKKFYKFAFGTLGILAIFLSFYYFSLPGTGIDKEKIPVEEVNFLKRINPEGNIFCSPGYGGYLIYNFYPEKKVFWDGRNELYFELLKEFEISLKTRENWENFLEKHKIEWAIIKYQGLQKVKKGEKTIFMPFSSIYFKEDKWELVFWDDSGMVFMKKGLMPLKSFKFNPEVPDYLIYLIKNNQIKKEEVIKEMEEKLLQNPNCKRAKKIRGQVLNLD